MTLHFFISESEQSAQPIKEENVEAKEQHEEVTFVK